MENELQKWERITAGNPSLGRASVADLWKLLDGATVESRRIDQPSPDVVRKQRVIQAVNDELRKVLGPDFMEGKAPEAKPYQPQPDAEFRPVRVGSLSELTQLATRAHSGQLETPTSTWKPPIRKRERVSDDAIRERELRAARTGDWESVVGKSVH